MIPFMAKLHFQQQLLQSSVSHDPSEIILIFWFSAQDIFLLVLKLDVLFNIFVETNDFFAKIFW